MEGNFIICTFHQILFKWSNHRGWHGWACGTCEAEEKCMSGFEWLSVKEIGCLEGLGMDGRVIGT